MKITPSTRLLTVFAAAFAVIGFTSCQSYTPKAAADQIARASYTDVLGFNGAMAPQSRQYANYGPLSADTRDAIREYLAKGKTMNVEYAHPQYYVIVDNSCWAICADTTGNMTGIMALPSRGKQGIAPSSDARLRPASGSYKIIHNDTADGNALSYKIMKGLEHADAYRKSVRKRLGLSEPVSPIKPTSKPVVIAAPTPAATSATAKPATPAATDTTAEETGDATPAATDDTGFGEDATPAADAADPFDDGGTDATPADPPVSEEDTMTVE